MTAHCRNVEFLCQLVQTHQHTKGGVKVAVPETLVVALQAFLGGGFGAGVVGTA